MTCHVYIDYKPDGTPFYVGKGNISRIKHLDRNKWHTKVRNKYPEWQRKIVETTSEDLCLEFEILLIQTIGRRDLGLGPLVNLTDGGEGNSNPSEEARKLLSEKLTLVRADPTLRKHHSEMMTLYYKKPGTREKTGQISSKIQNTDEAKARRSVISKEVAKRLGSEFYSTISKCKDAEKHKEIMKVVNSNSEKIEKQRKSMKAVMSGPDFLQSHTLRMRELGQTEHFRKAVSEGTKLAVNRQGVQEKRSVYLKLKYAYIRFFNLPRYYRGATKEVVFEWAEKEGLI